MKSVLSNVGRCVLAGSLVWLVGCGEKGFVSPGGDRSFIETEFPDSVTRSAGLPPFAVIPSGTGVLFDPHAPGDFSGLAAHATSEITDAGPRMLRATMWVLNHGAQAVSVLYGACDGGVSLESSGRAAWQSSAARDPRD